jgi:hypothetical protein
MRGTPDQAGALMKAYAGELEAWELGAAVGNVKNNAPELMERANPSQAPGRHVGSRFSELWVTTNLGF